MKPFTLYDILGVLAPGTVLTVGIATLYPETIAPLAHSEFTVGEFGLIVLVSYVVGNLVAALGNLIEVPYWWLFGGRHTEQAQKARTGVLSVLQLGQIETKLHETELLPANMEVSGLSRAEWYALTRLMHSYVEVRKLTTRVEIFNAQYGMNRGIAAGLLALSGLVFFHHGLERWRIAILLVGAALLAFYRMHRFSLYYAQTLFRQFIVAPALVPKTDEDNEDDE